MKVLLKYTVWWYISGDNQQAILKLELPQKYYIHECEEQNLTVWLQITNKQNIRKHQNYNNENHQITY